MKFLKSISLFFLYPMVTFCLGIYIGVAGQDFFYPGRQDKEPVPQVQQMQENSIAPGPEASSAADAGQEILPVSIEEDKLTVDTQYVLEEVDTKKGTSVETAWKLPQKYIGMNREQFIEAMEQYELSPPLLELERGFIGLDVLNFSTEKVKVRMNYVYVEPTESFYMRVENNYVVVYCDDKETVYMYTEILLEELPDGIQQDIIQGMYMDNEEALYNFLETYSS